MITNVNLNGFDGWLLCAAVILCRLCQLSCYYDQQWLILLWNDHFHLNQGRVNFATLDLGGSWLLFAAAAVLQLFQNFFELFVQQTSNQEQFLVHLFQTAKITSF